MTDDAIWVKVAIGMLVVTGLITLFSLAFLGGGDVGNATLLGSLSAAPTLTLQMFLIGLIVLAFVRLVMWIAEQRWFDGNGAGVEMAAIRRRLGTPDERPGDAGAVAQQYLANRLLIGLSILALLIAHRL